MKVLKYVLVFNVGFSGWCWLGYNFFFLF